MNHDEFSAIVAAVLDRLPAPFIAALADVEVLVVDAPDATLFSDDLDTSDPPAPGELLGLYVGTPLPERDATHAGVLSDVIYIFRLPHLALGLGRAALEREIGRTVMHEVAHYFGFDDEWLEREGWG
ncbi:MAG: metallopeptidase family protein [Pseudomonadota bacterium]